MEWNENAISGQSRADLIPLDSPMKFTSAAPRGRGTGVRSLRRYFHGAASFVIPHAAAAVLNALFI